MSFELFIASRYLRAKRRQAVIGIITAIIGAPYFIYLLRRRRTEVGWD